MRFPVPMTCSWYGKSGIPHLLFNFSIITTVDSWAPSQYPKRRLSVRSRKVSKPRDLYLELSDRYEI